ncbi:hypothetical protein MLD38_017956 [Melastoma candidum]|nr:hypothetical protein MLD38_017956 [Melastoma candidum]
MVPFCQIQQICSGKIIEEHVETASRIHVIDLAIRCGLQWVVLMQALAGRHKHPVKLLKITAIGNLSEESIENTGERLELFARSLNLPFKFKMIMSSEIDVLNEGLFGKEEGESVIVCAQFVLRTWIPWPDKLDALMAMIKRINPCVMVVNEVNWDFSSLSLFSRFKEALFYFGSYFDCLNDCMDREDNNRMIFELMFLGQAINIIMQDGEERTYTNINMAAWRVQFAQFGMVEMDLSEDCLYQADLVKNNFKCGSSCTIGMDGKSLIVGWKGVPMHLVSAWRFQ